MIRGKWIPYFMIRDGEITYVDNFKKIFIIWKIIFKNMHIQYYPIAITPEDYQEGVDSQILDSRAQEVIDIFHEKFLSVGVFYDVFLVPKDDEVFRSMAENILTEYNAHLMRLIEIVVLEPWIDYLDTGFEDFYDHKHDKFVPYSRYYH